MLHSYLWPSLARPLLVQASVLLAFLGLAPAASAQQEQSIACSPDFEPARSVRAAASREFLDQDAALNATIEEIHFTRLPIFDESDPDEDNWLFRWANHFHFLTRESTIDQQLLFDSGDDYDTRLLQESARLLRRQGLFYDVAIRPASQCGDAVKVEVVTRDTWSLTPNLSYDRAGGEDSFSIGLRDSNFLGRGELVAISTGQDTERASNEFEYLDNNLFGSRVRNRILLVDSDDGDTQQFDIDLPFFALESRQSWAIRLLKQRRQDEQHLRGEEVSAVAVDERDFTLELGRSEGLEQGVVRRWRFGYRYREQRFAEADHLPPPDSFPVDRELSYPYVDFQLLEDDYVTAFNLDQIFRTEDLNLGQELRVTLGYASQALGSDADLLVLEGQYSSTLLYDGDRLWQHRLQWEGLWNRSRSGAEDLLVSYENRYFHRQTDSRAFFAQFTARYARNLNSNREVTLGGDTGARAFDNHFQTGDRLVRFTIEERLYTDLHLLNLIRVGGAVFADVGRAWSPGVMSPTNDDVLANVGFGLRLASSKAASDRIAHLDFAFPVTNRDDPRVDSMLVAFTIKGNF